MTRQFGTKICNKNRYVAWVKWNGWYFAMMYTIVSITSHPPVSCSEITQVVKHGWELHVDMFESSLASPAKHATSRRNIFFIEIQWNQTILSLICLYHVKIKKINCEEYFYWYVTFKGCSSDHVGCKSHCAITKTNWYGSKFTDILNNKIRPIILWWLTNHHHSLNHHRYDSSFIGSLFNLLSYLQLSVMTEE